MIQSLRRVLGIDKPLLSGPLGGAAGPELVAALWGDPAHEVRDGIRRTRMLTDKNFAVNLNVSVDYNEALQVCIDDAVHAVSLFWGQAPVQKLEECCARCTNGWFGDAAMQLPNRRRVSALD